MTSLIDVKDNASDKDLQALAELINLSSPIEKQVDWKTLRRDFSNSDWKPKLMIVEASNFHYHAYAINSKGKIEKEGEYFDRKQAERCAMDLAMCLNSR